tara:strand:+ start:27749 stop:28597 length:849 start_codon:yes stop_codon:yes gene_type:complete
MSNFLIFSSAFFIAVFLFFILINVKHKNSKKIREERNRKLFEDNISQLNNKETMSSDISEVVAKESETTLSNDLLTEEASLKIIPQSTLKIGFISLMVLMSILAIYFKPFALGSSDDVENRIKLDIFLTESKISNEESRNEILRILKSYFKKKNISSIGWSLLAQRLNDLREYDLSSSIYKNLIEDSPKDLSIDIYSDYAQTLFMLDKSKFTPRVKTAISEAYEKTPLNPAVLTLKGIQEFQSGKPKIAKGYWDKALNSMTDEDQRAALEQAINSLYLRKNQ